MRRIGLEPRLSSRRRSNPIAIRNSVEERKAKHSYQINGLENVLFALIFGHFSRRPLARSLPMVMAKP